MASVVGLPELAELGKVTGIAGVAIGALLLLVRSVLDKVARERLGPEGLGRLLRLIIVLAFSLALVGGLTWAGVTIINRWIDNDSGDPLVQDDCNIAVQTGRVSEATITVGDVTCKGRPEAALRIRYYWLDANSYSLLAAGRPGASMRPLFGENPTLIANEVHANAQDLIQRFGYIMRNTGGVFHSAGLVGPPPLTGADSGNVTTFEVNPQAITGVRAYGPELPFFVPDADAFRTVFRSTQWPADYQMFYVNISPDIDAQLGDDELLPRTVLWRPFTRAEARSYDQRVGRVAAEFGDPPTQNAQKVVIYFPQKLWPLDLGDGSEAEPDENDSGDEPVEEPIDSSEVFRTELAEIKRMASTGTLAAMRYVARRNWPKDFVIAYGEAETVPHTEELEWTIIAYPREMSVLVAVLEVIGEAGATLPLKEVHLRRQAEPTLRETEYGLTGETRRIRPPTSPTTVGERLVIPLRIEFKEFQDVEVGHLRLGAPDKAAGRDYYQRVVSKLPAGQVLRWGAVQKDVSAFRPPVYPALTPSYTYGVSYVPIQAVVDDQKAPLRQLDPAEVYLFSGFEGGSCPIVYSRSENGRYSRLRPILVEANGRMNAGTDRLVLPEGTSRIALREEEPETSHISSIKVYAERRGRRDLVAKTGPFVLGYGQELEIRLPPSSPGDRLVMEVQGYYERYRWHDRIGVTAGSGRLAKSGGVRLGR